VNVADLAGLRFSLVGPGRVGGSLAGWAQAAGARLVSVAGRRPDGAAARAASLLGGRPVALADLETGGEDFLLVAVSDPDLDTVAEALALRRQAAVVWHTAGARDASALARLRHLGSAVGSLHPLRAFPAVQPTPEVRTFYAIDGDPAATRLARRLVAAWNGVCAEVPAESRRLYHLGAWLSAGGVTTLLAAAASLAAKAGLPDEVSLGYRELAHGAIAALGPTAGAAGRITGPVARGDAELVLRQFEELAHLAPELVPLARSLALETLSQIERARPLDEGQSSLREALGKRFIP
jgi:predicted short-subunit dehydrogenase-like oxidoreductase (DUF2520 family)